MSSKNTPRTHKTNQGPGFTEIITALAYQLANIGLLLSAIFVGTAMTLRDTTYWIIMAVMIFIFAALAQVVKKDLTADS